MTDLETLERLLAAATPGPWKYLSARWPYEVWSEAAGAALGLPSAKLLELWSSHEDGEFIVALVNAAPGLLTELKELLRIRDEQSEYVHVLEETVTELNVGALELERELQAARNVVELVRRGGCCFATFSEECEKTREAVAAIAEYDAAVAGKVTT